MYEFNEDTGKIEFSHNPFSMPQGGMEAPQGTRSPSRPIITTSSATAWNCRRAPSATICRRSCTRPSEIAGYPASEVETRFGGM